MQYLLDTCVLSDFVKGNLNTINKITQSHPQDLAISSLTIMEIEYGVLRSPGQKSTSIKNIINSLIEEINIISLDRAIALEAASIRANLHKHGTPIGYYDILIGATARHHNLIMVTANVAEFIRIDGMSIQNWRDINI